MGPSTKILSAIDTSQILEPAMGTWMCITYSCCKAVMNNFIGYFCSRRTGGRQQKGELAKNSHLTDFENITQNN